MIIENHNFDLEDMPITEVLSLHSKVLALKQSSAFSRSDLESLENTVTGAVTDDASIDMNEYSSVPSAHNYSIIISRINDIGRMIEGRYSKFYSNMLSDYRLLYAMCTKMGQVLYNFRTSRVNPVDISSRIYFYGDAIATLETFYPFMVTSDTAFSAKKNDIEALNLADTLNSMIVDYKSYYASRELSTEFSKVDANSFILIKDLLDKDSFTYNDVVSLLVNPDKIMHFLNNLKDSMLSSLSDVSANLKYNWSDDITTRWSGQDMIQGNITKYIADDTSLVLLDIIGKIRYRD